MADANPELVEGFKAKAESVNAVVYEMPNLEAAFQYVVDVCEKKAPCEMMADEEGTEKGPLGPNKVPTRLQKIMAAPSLPDDEYAALEKLCQEKNILLIKNGMRKYLAGIDIGVTPAMLGVAASGTCMVDTTDEDTRLAGMVSEINVLFLDKNEIYPDLPSITDKMRACATKLPGTFTTLITGPSRTADIERVPAVGVHGPLELHIILLEGKGNA